MLPEYLVLSEHHSVVSEYHSEKIGKNQGTNFKECSALLGSPRLSFRKSRIYFHLKWSILSPVQSYYTVVSENRYLISKHWQGSALQLTLKCIPQNSDSYISYCIFARMKVHRIKRIFQSMCCLERQKKTVMHMLQASVGVCTNREPCHVQCPLSYGKRGSSGSSYCKICSQSR